ncbi:MAG: asparagine synthase-related protein [Salinivirgaceae bacterium]|jgi:asparagine synthase (glutamine-hydrolysing)|nr:asparagine synthase-related protein [Salinivirgaceae bacterium]
MIELNQDKGFKWYQKDKLWVKGAFFDTDNNYFEKEQLTDYFKNITTYKTFIAAVKNCNGIFTIVIHKDEEIWCAIDRCATFPLFYFEKDNGWLLTDNYEFVKESKDNFKIDSFQLNVYKGFGHTFGNETLINDVFQVQCAQAIKLSKDGQKEALFYHSFSRIEFVKDSHENLLNKGVELFEESFSRLIKSLNNRTAVIPLSGGFDSRMIAAGLKKQGYEKVICFTYGKKENNNEYNLSKKVAHQLGFTWIFVEYNSTLFQNYSETKEFQEYMHYMCHLGSMFYLQEYFAVKYLKDNNLVPDDAVFLPGHSGDLLGGSQLIKAFDKGIKVKDIPAKFIQKKNIFMPFKKVELLKQKIEIEIDGAKESIGATVIEELDIREKISKIIFNSSRVFDYFTYEKRYVFWDVQLLNFFLSLPFKEREMKKLYDEILVQSYFKPLNIHFSQELQPVKKQLHMQKFKDKVKKIMPLNYRIKLLIKKDWINYYKATRPLVEEMHIRGGDFKFFAKSFNEVLISYYIYSLNKK